MSAAKMSNSEFGDPSDSESDHTITNKSSDIGTVLSRKHPEVFSVTPRRGGYLKWVLPHKSKHFILKSNSSSEIYNSYSTTRSKSMIDAKSSDSSTTIVKHDCRPIQREDQLHYTLEGSNCSRETGNSQIKCDCEMPVNDMLSTTISCVRLMASDLSKVPEKYLTSTERYLTTIQDEDESRPPNIQGILNHIKYLREKKLLDDVHCNSASYRCLQRRRI